TSSSLTTCFSFHLSDPHHNLHSFPPRRSSDLSGRGLTLDVRALARMRQPIESPQLREHPALSRRRRTARGARQRLLEPPAEFFRSEEHTSELQSRFDLVCRLLLEKKKKTLITH